MLCVSPQLSFQEPWPISLKSGFLTDLDLTGWARLAGQGASGACLCLCASAEIIGGCHHGVLWGLSSVLVLVRQYPEPRNLAEFKEIKCPGRTYLLLFRLNLCPQPNAEAVAEAGVTFPHQRCGVSHMEEFNPQLSLQKL